MSIYSYFIETNARPKDVPIAISPLTPNKARDKSPQQARAHKPMQARPARYHGPQADTLSDSPQRTEE